MKKVEIHPEAVERVKKFTISDNNLGFGKYVAPVMIQAIYDDGQWHLIERSYGGSTPAHRLRVDNEVVTGQYTFSAFNWKNGAIIGNSGMFELLTKFRGDIDYVSTGLAP